MYEERNKKSFEALKSGFTKLFPVRRPEDHGIDVAVYLNEDAYNNGKTPMVYVELEICTAWVAHDYPPYKRKKEENDVQFLLKKQRFAELDRPAYMVLFNNDCTNSAMISFSKLLQYPTITRPCTSKSMPERYQDGFFRVPQDRLTWSIAEIELQILRDAFNALCKLHQGGV